MAAYAVGKKALRLWVGLLFVVFLSGGKPARAANNDRAQAYVAQGNRYRDESKDCAKAIQAYKQAAAVQPSNADAQLGLGVCYKRQEQWRLSIAAWNKYITLTRPLASAFLLLGIAHFKLEEYDQSLAALRRVANFNPDAEELGDASFWAGEIYDEKGQYQNAVPAFKEALRLNPNDPNSYRELGADYYLLSQYPEALAALQRAVLLNPGQAKAQHWLGKTYLALGRRDEALQVWKTLQATDEAEAQKLSQEISGPVAVAATTPAPEEVEEPPGEGRVLGRFQFASGSSRPQEGPAGQQSLRELSLFLAQHREITKVRIEGHTNSRGAPDGSLTLSRDRAIAIKNDLMKLGVGEDRLVVFAFGSLKPIADNATAAGRALNDRVECQVAELNGHP